MKKTLILFCFSIATFVYSNALTCSNTFYNGDTVSIVLCADDYDPAPTLVGGDPTTFYANLPALDEYAINGHIEFETLMYDDFIVIRAEDANHNTLFNLGTFYGIQDICLYTPNIQYLAVDIYCYHGAVSSTSGFNLTIRPTEKAVMEQLAVMDRLGIGTSTPEANLHVVGDIRLSDEHHYMTMHPTGSFSTNRNQFNFNKPIRSDVGVFSSSSTSNLTLQTYNTPRMTILKDNGYVGIGTTEPQAMLDVRGRLHVQNDDGWVDIGPVNWGFMHFYTDRPRFYFNKPIFVQGGIISSIEHVNLQLQTFHTTRLTIQDGTGNVGIGIDTPLYKLDVVGKIHASDSILCTVVKAPHAQISQLQAIGVTSSNLDAYTIRARSDVLTVTAPTLDCTGKIRANEIIVNSGGGADFVFEKDYNLRSLDEVNSFIQEHQHLPEIPSAQQMQEDGMSVDQMVVKLLQKIEELTLYTIQQEERIKDLEQKQTPK